MTTHEAKTILHSCRPSGGDAHDPRIAEALVFAEQDPELKAWFTEWQAMDCVIAAKLKTAPGLPEALLQEVRTGAQARAATRPPWFQQPLALAAGLLLLGTLATLWWAGPDRSRPAGEVAALRADMAEFLREFPLLDLETDRLPEVQQWLAAHHTTVPENIPEAFKTFPTIGCRTVKWRDAEIALVCFMVDGEVVHLLLLPAETLPELRAGAAPQLAEVGRFSTAVWSSGKTAFLAMTPGDPEVLDKVL